MGCSDSYQTSAPPAGDVHVEIRGVSSRIWTPGRVDPEAEQGEMGHFCRLDAVLGERRADNSTFPKWNNSKMAETSTQKPRHACFFPPLQSERLMQLLLPTLSSTICVLLRQTELLNIKSGDPEQTERPSKLSAGLCSLQSAIQE